MTKVKDEKDESKNTEQAFSKQQIISAKKYKHRKDLLNVLLEDGKKYTLQQVDELIDKFMKGKVK